MQRVVKLHVQCVLRAIIVHPPLLHHKLHARVDITQQEAHQAAHHALLDINVH